MKWPTSTRNLVINLLLIGSLNKAWGLMFSLVLISSIIKLKLMVSHKLLIQMIYKSYKYDLNTILAAIKSVTEVLNTILVDWNVVTWFLKVNIESSED